MPQLIAIVAIGAGLYAGMKWATRNFQRVAEAGRAARQTVRPRSAQSPAGGPRDLGSLEWDDRAKAYRPKHNG